MIGILILSNSVHSRVRALGKLTFHIFNYLFSRRTFSCVEHLVEHKCCNLEAPSGSSSPQISCYIVHCRAVCFTSFVLLLLLALALLSSSLLLSLVFVFVLLLC
jgi:hypothetical protein